MKKIKSLAPLHFDLGILTYMPRVSHMAAVICTAILLFSTSTVTAQPPTINISFMIAPPYPVFLSSYEEKMNEVIFTITNTGSSAQELYFHGEITKSTGERVATREDYKPSVPFSIGAFETVSITLSEIPALDGAFNQSNMEIIGFDPDQIQLSGVIPEGVYTICVRALDFSTDQVVSIPGTGCSNPFNVLHAMPPRLNYPANAYTFCQEFGLLQFNWTPVQQAPGSVIVYDLEIIDLTILGLEEEDPLLPFVDGAARFYVVEDIPTPQYNYFAGGGDIPFEPNHKYAWRVRARDIMETTFIRDEGYSEAFTFTFCPAPEGGDFDVTAVYPKDNDTIPFTFPYLAVRFSPLSDNYDRIEYDLVITGEGVNINRTVNVHWGAQGPANRVKAFWPDATDNQCSTVPLLRTEDLPDFRLGKTYTWRGDVTVHQGSHSYRKNILPQRFTYGMPKPKTVRPVTEHTVNPADLANLEFEFSPGNLSSNYLPPYTMLEVNSLGISPPAREIQSRYAARWILQICKNDSTFSNPTDIIVRATGWRNADLPQRGEIDKDVFKESIEKNIKTRVNEALGDQTLEDGRYFWRVGWSAKPNDTDNNETVMVWAKPSVVVLDSSVPASDPSGGSDSDCMSDCETSAPTNTSDPKTLSIGEEVQVGRFTMTVKQLNNPGASNRVFHGQGSIPLQFMGIDVKVQFQNLQVNGEGQMYAGMVEGLKEEAIFNVDVENINGIGIPSIDSSNLANMESFMETGGRIVSALIPGSEIGLPLGFDQIIDDVRVVIGIVEMDFTPTKATINAVANFNLTEISDDFNLGFGAAEICMNPDGFNANNAELYLARSIIIPFETDDSDDPVLVSFKGLNHPDFEYSRRNVTHIRLDCNGFRDGQILIETTFPKSVFTALNANGTDKAENLKATATGRFDAAGGILLGLTFSDRFYFTDFDDMSFVVDNAWLDLSSRANPSGFSFPQGYADSTLANAPRSSIRNGWTGFYMKNVTAYFKYVHTSEDDGDYRNQFSIGLENVILDHTGFSAKIYMANLVNWNENEDNLDGWAFALDTIDITFVSNNLTSGSVAARLGFPMDKTQYLKTKFTLAYDHSKSKFKFTVSVKPDGDFKVDAWAARLELHQSSKIELSISDEVDIKVDLTGSISIRSEFKEDFDDLPGTFTFPSLEFERIIITSKRGFEGGTINNRNVTSIPGSGGSSGGGSSAGTSSGEGNNAQRVAQFPIDINSIDLNVRGVNEVVLGVDIMLTFTNDGSGLSGGTKLNFVANYDISKLEFTDINVELEKIHLSASFTPIQIKGEIEIFKRSLPGGGYEERFKGSLDVKLPAELEGRLEAEFGMYVENPDAPYGSEEHFSFFRIDGRVSGFSLTLTPWMAVTGFGGGVYHRMKIVDPCDMPRVNPEHTRAGEYGSSAPAVLSGTTYTRDYNTVVGFRVMLQAGFPNNDEVYNLDVTVGAEIAEDAHGSIFLQRLYFQGDVYVMTKISERANPKIYAGVNLAYQNTSGSSPLITGNFDLFVDVKIHGLELLKGNMGTGSSVFTECGTQTNISCGCQAAAARLRIPLDDTAGEEWYFYMGHWSPDEPFENRGSLLLNVVDFLEVEISHYLMAGNGLPRNLPPLPESVSSILNGPSSDEGDPGARAALGAETNKVMARLAGNRDEMNAAGFAMGAYFRNRIDLRFAIFYATFEFILGFDINITQSDVECHNPEGPGTFQRGLDGWYGQGQAYLAMEGDLGVYIDLFFIKGRFSIVNLAAAVMIQAGIPNPEYFRGRVGLRYSILNGMVEGHCNFQMDIGQKCQPVNPNPFGIDLIADLAPDGGDDLSVFTVPVAAYNFPINRILTFEEEVDYDEYRLKHIKGFVHKFEIREGRTNGPIARSTTTHSADNLESRAEISDWLKPEQRYHVILTMRAREYSTSRGGGERQVIVGGRPWEETRRVSFTTGERPDHLTDDNVRYTYPLQRQRFYMQDEGIPHIRLRIRMPGLTPTEIAGIQYDYYLRLIGLETRDTTEVKYTHNVASGFAWQFPGLTLPNLNPETHYCLQIIRRPSFQLSSELQGIDFGALNNQVNPALTAGLLPGAIFEQITVFEEYDDADENTGPSTSELTTVSIVGSDLAPNEHLIYSYYFRTSKYRRLSDKMARYQFTPQNPTTLTTPLTCDFDEPFDIYDVNGYTKNGARVVRPLINITPAQGFNGLSGRIFTDYTIYNDLVTYLRPRSVGICRTSDSFLSRNTNAFPFDRGIPPSDVVTILPNMVSDTVTTAQLHQAGGTTPSSSGTSSNPFQMIPSAIFDVPINLNIGPSNSGPPIHFRHEQALWFSTQHFYMRRNINNLLAYHCFWLPNPNFQWFLSQSPQLNRRVQDFRNRHRSYFYYSHGTYQMNFRYRTPSGHHFRNGTSSIKSFFR